ncbi:hypothetical protein [Sulfobacillus thermosulfidooxidans]|nr:hypothetical protein [Sulfobacillus thermosulfidooxidans]
MVKVARDFGETTVASTVLKTWGNTPDSPPLIHQQGAPLRLDVPLRVTG